MCTCASVCASACVCLCVCNGDCVCACVCENRCGCVCDTKAEAEKAAAGNSENNSAEDDSARVQQLPSVLDIVVAISFDEGVRVLSRAPASDAKVAPSVRAWTPKEQIATRHDNDNNPPKQIAEKEKEKQI